MTYKRGDAKMNVVCDTVMVELKLNERRDEKAIYDEFKLGATLCVMIVVAGTK